MRDDTLPGLLAAAAARLGQTTALREKNLGEWQPISWQQYFTRVKNFALGLADLGLKRGERVAILAHNCPEWLYADLAIQAAGGVSICISPLSSADEAVAIMRDREATLCITGDHEQTEKVLPVTDALPALRKIVVVDPRGLHKYSGSLLASFQEVAALGQARAAVEPGYFDRQLASVSPADLATVGYEPGTDGLTKAVPLTHQELLVAAARWLAIIPLCAGDVLLSYLPLSMTCERVASAVLPLKVGCVISFASGSDTLEESLREVAPSVFLGTSRALAGLVEGPLSRISKTKGLRRWACRAGLAAGANVTASRQAVKPLPFAQRIGYWLANPLVLRPILAKVGLADIRALVCADHTLAPEYQAFLNSLGVPTIWLDASPWHTAGSRSPATANPGVA